MSASERPGALMNFLKHMGSGWNISLAPFRGKGFRERCHIRYQRQKDGNYKVEVRVESLPTLLDIEFDSPVWKKWGDKCLSCGSCGR